ncbi:MAG: chromosomal replication initiator protein DnaA [Bacilli bacterium]|nr:chromosomal replication initiator protein DnaA [Bacilli bacterium]
MDQTVTELVGVWKNALDYIKQELNDNRVFDTVFSGSKILSISGNKMRVAASTGFATNLFQTRFLETIRRAVNRTTGTDFDFEFVFQNEENDTVSSLKPRAPLLFQESHLDPKYTFDNFIIGPSDREASQAASLIAGDPGKMYNPLLIYGDSGLGKTHLLQAIGNAVREDNPKLKVLYVSADDFLQQYVAFATGAQSDHSFSEFFRSEVDVLLLDDVQYLRNKAKTMEAFFNVFQILANGKKQIVLTCDQHPDKIDGLDERLKTRFSQGLSVQIKKPDLATSKEILRSKISASGLREAVIDDEVIELLASQFSDNVRELEGALNRLLFHSIQCEPTRHIDIKVATRAISDLSEAKSDKVKLTATKIVATVADYYSLTQSQVMGKIRTANIALARHIAMFLCRTLMSMNYSEIGKMFGKDHTSVMNAVDKVEKLWKTDTSMSLAIDQLKKKLGA